VWGGGGGGGGGGGLGGGGGGGGVGGKAKRGWGQEISCGLRTLGYQQRNEGKSPKEKEARFKGSIKRVNSLNLSEAARRGEGPGWAFSTFVRLEKHGGVSKLWKDQ